MIIREATAADIPDILRVLKASLGETSSQKTEDVWRFKHIDNPFGPSLVLLAEEAGEIIGVRAFMRWQWQKGNNIFSAFRAVDTATHPKHQGKGVFKKLTLKAVEMATKQGDHFVFNTPNDQSRPGYLKMGWKEVSRLKVHLMPTNPLSWFSKAEEEYSSVSYNFRDLEETLIGYHRRMLDSEKLFTPKNRAFLEWRYLNNPLQDYWIEGTDTIFIAAYIKDQKYFKELRISELLFKSDADKPQIRKIVKNMAKVAGAQVVSYHSPENKSISFFRITGAYGPTLTFKKLNSSAEIFLNLNSWGYSLGDLELF